MSAASSTQFLFGGVDLLRTLRGAYGWAEGKRYVLDIGNTELRPIADWATEERSVLIRLVPEIGIGRFVLRQEEP